MSNNLDPKAHASFVGHCFEVAKKWEKELGVDISYINVGGGIGVNYENVEEQFDWDDFMNRLNSIQEENKDAKWQTVFECGRYITSSCGYYAAEVLDIKKIMTNIFVYSAEEAII